MNNEEFLQFQGQMKAPFPGQSLANDPENPAPYEKAPRFTSVHEATYYLWTEITDPEMYIPVMETLQDGTPVLDVVQTILFGEFQRGAWNPDLMLMLVEPLSYMFIALAERLDIDVVIYSGEMEDEDAEEELLGVKFEESRIEDMKKAAKAGRVPEGTLSNRMKAELKELPELPSLLSKVPEEIVEPAPEQSLMASPEGI
jgi:hypothetical protein|tara:strand:+ start:1940 stop:2539 length:600 start_codon:yes stop_codon:yes gene_type:complete